MSTNAKTGKVAELEAKLAGKNSTPHAPREEVFTRSVKSTLDESRTAQTTPAVNQTSPAPEVASPIQKAPSGDRPESPRPVSERLNQVNHSGRGGASGQPFLSRLYADQVCGGRVEALRGEDHPGVYPEDPHPGPLPRGRGGTKDSGGGRM